MRVFSIRFFSFAISIVCIDLTSLSRPETGLVRPATGLQEYDRLLAHRNVCIILKPATGLQECMHNMAGCRLTRMYLLCFSIAVLIVCIVAFCRAGVLDNRVIACSVGDGVTG